MRRKGAGRQPELRRGRGVGHEEGAVAMPVPIDFCLAHVKAGATMCRTQAVAQIPKHKVEFLCFVKKEHNITTFESELLSQRRGLPRTNVVSASAQRLFA